MADLLPAPEVSTPRVHLLIVIIVLLIFVFLSFSLCLFITPNLFHCLSDPLIFRVLHFVPFNIILRSDLFDFFSICIRFFNRGLPAL